MYLPMEAQVMIMVVCFFLGFLSSGLCFRIAVTLFFVFLQVSHLFLIEKTAAAYFQPGMLFGTFLGLLAFLSGAVLKEKAEAAKKIKLLIVLSLLTSAFQIFFWKNYHSIQADVCGYRDVTGLIRQSTGSTCTPASVANILKHYGVEKTEKELAALFRTTPAGTYNYKVLHSLKDIGFCAEAIVLPPKDYKKLPVPCLIFIDFPGLGPGGHAACYSGVLPDKKIQLDDPLTGTQMLEEEKFLEIWPGRGIKITPEKNRGP
jgi:hypothetical protein